MAFAATSIEVNGLKLAFRQDGAGSPLLFLHGTDGLAEWPPLLDRLAQRRRVIAPDHPGFGDTPAPEWIDDISDMAYFYLDALAALRLGRVHVVGHSLGGWIALEMAVREPGAFSALSLIAAAGIRVKGVPKADIFLIDPDEQARLAWADAALGEAAAERARTAKYQETAVRNRIAAARLGWQPRFFNPRLERWLHRVAAPTQILWGAEDRVIPPAYGEAFQRLIPGARLTVIERAGHLPHYEQAARAAAAIEGFPAP